MSAMAPQEAIARHAKVEALAAALRAMMPDATPLELFAVAKAAPDHLWVQLAELADVRPPSETTVAWLVASLERATRTPVADPWAGLT